MKRSKGASPVGIAALVTAYFAGIITVAVLCCDDWRQVADAINPPASASAMDGGEQAPADLSSLAFVFDDIDEIASMTASVHIDADEEILEGFRLYKTGGVMVVEVQAEMNRNFRPHFYFLNRKDEVVEEYRANVFVNRSLITYHSQTFGVDEQFPYHAQPEEIQANVGETTFTLEHKSRLWVEGQFLDMWQVVHLPADSQASASNCTLTEIGQPSTVGIISDGTSGETVSLEVLP